MTDIFLHIPKAAGQTIISGLRLNYRRKYTIEWETLTKPVSSLTDIPFDQRNRARLVRGHLHYGVHRYLPQEARYITMLRNPVDRVVSLYKFILRREVHPLHGRVTSIEEYVESGMDRAQTENGQTRLIAGLQTTEPDPAALELAKENLRSFAAVGIQDRFDESFTVFRRRLGWKLPIYLSRNVTKSDGEVPERVVRMIEERNALDAELVAHATDLLDASIAAEGRSFRRDLLALRLVNPVMGAAIQRLPRRG